MDDDAASLVYAPKVERTPEAVRAGLDPDQRDLFDEQARAEGVEAALDCWHAVAQTQAKGPGVREWIEAVNAAIDAGTASTVPANLDQDD